MKTRIDRARRTLLITAAVMPLALGSCRPLPLYGVEPAGPAEYQLGWQDGCDSGISANSPLFYKLMYGFKKRPEMGANDLYKQGWNEGFTYCRFGADAWDKQPSNPWDNLPGENASPW